MVVRLPGMFSEKLHPFPQRLPPTADDPALTRLDDPGARRHRMNADHALSLLDRMLWSAGLIAGPLLLSILVVGVIISVLQVATQVQEMTLTYIPKLIVSVLVLILLGSWMMRQTTQFAEALFRSIPQLAQ
jgi:flagellar biosynthetic protein FliQ